MPVIPVLGLGRRIEFKSSLGYTSRPCLKNKNKTKSKTKKTPNIGPIKIAEIATSSSKARG